MPRTAIIRPLLVAITSIAAALLWVIGLLMVVSWTMWCASALVVAAIAVSADILGRPRTVSFEPGLHPWPYTAIGVVGVLCVLLSRRLLSWMQPAARGADRSEHPLGTEDSASSVHDVL